MILYDVMYSYMYNRSGLYTLPHNAKIHYNYANFLKDNGRELEAIAHYKNAVMLVE